MIRFGLCCIFKKERIRFRAATAKTLASLARKNQLARLSELCLHNAQNLLLAVQAVNRLGIKAFRITSPLFPRYTHPEVGYTLDDLPGAEKIAARLHRVRAYSRQHDIRLSLHPDQFVVLGTPDEKTAANTRKELEYQGMLAEMAGAEVINIHAGGGYGDKQAALKRLAARFGRLSSRVRSRLTLENDNTLYTPEDLLPLCKELNIPLVYDVHHHRCNPDGLSVEKATRLSVATWQRAGREPCFHVSSPKHGWQSTRPGPHAEYVDPADFPDCWQNLDATVDIEAKAKELAVIKLMRDLERLEQEGG